MLNLLIAAFGKEGLTYARQAQQLGLKFRVLDCFEDHHRHLMRWYGEQVLQVQGRRAEVREMVARHHFDVAIIHEEVNFIRTALVTQSLREAGIPLVIVVTRDPAKRSMYRRCGAHRIVVADSEDSAWAMIHRYLPNFATA